MTSRMRRTQALPVLSSVPAATADGGGPGTGFWLGVVPVTVGEYWDYLCSAAADPAPRADPRAHGFPPTPGVGIRCVGGRLALDAADLDLPVTHVTWWGARAYCSWLGEQLGRVTRLPTAAEWEHAAGGGRGLRWALGDAFDRPLYAPEADGPRPVGSTPPNAFGLRDLTGNVFEWCADELVVDGPDGPVCGLGSRLLKGGAFTVRNPSSFENTTSFSADELTAVPYIGFRVLVEDAATASD